MLVAEARVPTERSRRYLVQLCRHVKLAARGHPRPRAQAEWSGDQGSISTDQGRCTLRAEPGVLTLRIEAPDEQSLHQLEQQLTHRLEQVGRRDKLTVTWTPTDDEKTPHMSDRPGAHDTGDDSGMAYEREPRLGVPRWVKVAVIVVAVVVLLGVVMLLVVVGGGGGEGGHGPSRH